MGEVVVKIEDLSKQYRLGLVGTGTISHDLNRWWYKFRGKEDPYLKIGETNERSKEGKSNLVWALKDININVERGEVLGIIGKNGAGKSTLLKILSQVTGPTLGKVKVKGRIGSLLEVGTGFHQELTGRENIFLNGAILGMTKSEIKSKLNEIIDFSGTKRYIDTPVKRYSSGMMVRLAFAVAAHLDPEILIVDEVLAVGDAEFQQKAIGKMQDVSEEEGRTVLFVSHNMDSINTLCTKCALIADGSIEKLGDTSDVVNYYIQNFTKNTSERSWIHNPPGDEFAELRNAILCDSNDKIVTNPSIDQDLYIEYEVRVKDDSILPQPNIHLFTAKNEFVCVSAQSNLKSVEGKGIFRYKVKIPSNLLNTGIYYANLALTSYDPQRVHFYEREAIVFEMMENINSRETSYTKAIPGVIRPKFDWETLKI